MSNTSNERKSSEYFDAKDHFSEERTSEDKFLLPKPGGYELPEDRIKSVEEKTKKEKNNIKKMYKIGERRKLRE